MGIVAPVRIQLALPTFSAIFVYERPSNDELAWIDRLTFVTGSSARFEVSRLIRLLPTRVLLVRLRGDIEPLWVFGAVPIAASRMLGIKSPSGSAFCPLIVASDCSARVNFVAIQLAKVSSAAASPENDTWSM